MVLRNCDLPPAVESSCAQPIPQQLLRRSRKDSIAKDHPVMVIECYRDSSAPTGLGGLPGIYSLRFPQDGLDIFPQRDFHCRLCVFKTTRLNSNGRVFAATAPIVIGEPELAFDTQKRRDPERT